jgi:hypothetical protein
LLTMKKRWIAGSPSGRLRRPGNRLAAAAAAAALSLMLVGVAPAEHAFAQQNSGGAINIGGGIADTVAGAVSGIASPSHASGGVQSSHSEMALGDQEGLAVSDASGGNRNASVTSK